MELILIQFVNGITLGMIYGLAALGFTMVFKALGYLNFSHSNSLTFSAFFTFILMRNLGFSIWMSLPAITVIMLLYGFLLDKIIFNKFANAPALTFMLVSISLSTILTNVSLLVFGPQPRALTRVFPEIKMVIAGVNIPFNNIFIFAIALIFLLALQIFFMKTKFGLAMRLSAEDKSTSSLMGVNITATRAATFAITAVLGGVSGLLVAPLYSVTIELGSSLALKTFIAAVVGGLGNFVGAVVGGLLIGVIEVFSTTFINSSYKDLIVYVFGILVLAFFPHGIFRRVTTKF